MTIITSTEKRETGTFRADSASGAADTHETPVQETEADTGQTESGPAGIDPAAPDAAAPQLTALTIPITALAVHPGNVRTDVSVSADFVATAKAEGIRLPLLITATSTPGVYRIIDGEKRYNAALKAGLNEVPYTFDATRADDEAGQYLDMLITSRYKTPLTPFEEAAALFSAEQAGASRARLTKAYGKRAGITNALKVARLPQDTRDAAREACYPWTLDELAQLEEFASDTEATSRLISAAEDHSFGYQIERERIERDEQQQRDAIRAELTAQGVTVADTELDGAARLSRLKAGDGTDLTADSHRECPGHVAVLERYGEPRAAFYCTDPAGNGHADRSARTSGTRPATASDAAAEAERKAQASAQRRLVIRGNKDWKAAEVNRRKWLTALHSRASMPREQLDMITRWTACTWLTMPGPVSKRAGDSAVTGLQAELLGITTSTASPHDWAQETSRANKARLALLSLAPLAASYERNMTPETWRTDTSPWVQAERRYARAWLDFCRALGHVLSPVEEAVLADTTYTPGDPSPSPAIADPGPGPDPDDDPARAGDDPDPASEDEDEDDPAASRGPGGAPARDLTGPA
jgi:ParB family chromosome partitioning protein